MVKLLLVLFDCIALPLRRLGVDYPQFRAIMEVKLTLDGRRRSSMHRTTEKSPRNSLLWTLVFHAFMGIFIAMFLKAAHSPLVGMTIAHTFVMTMVGMALIADFTTVLLDTTDNAILHPRPVSSRTILAARSAHITTYLGLLALSSALFPLIVGTFVYHPLFPLVFLWTLLCSVLLVVFAAQVFYLVALRLTNAEKFRDIILYFQIAMTVVIFGGYQLLPRLLDVQQLREFTIVDRGWIYFFPPTWMAAPVELLVRGGNPTLWTLSALSTVVPLGCLLLVIRVLAPRFSRAIASLEAAPSGSKVAATERGRASFSTRLSRFVSSSASQRAAFDWIWMLTSRDRPFKLRTYPMIAFVLVFGAVTIFSDRQGVAQAFDALPGTNKHLLLLYMACIMAPTAVMQHRFSTNPDAAWIYYALPLERPGDVLLAALKVIALRFVLPTFCLIASLVLLIWGGRVVWDVLLAMTAMVLISATQAMLFGRCFPFSQTFNVAEGSGRVAKSFLLMGIPAAAGGMHYLIKLTAPQAVPLAIPLELALIALVLRAYVRTPWSVLLRQGG